MGNTFSLLNDSDRRSLNASKEFLSNLNLDTYFPQPKTTWRNNAVAGKDARNINDWDSFYDISNLENTVTSNSKNWTLDQLNALQGQEFAGLSWDKQLNGKGYAGWNEAFNQLQGINTFFGYEEGKNDFMGPSTWNRHSWLTGMQNKHNSTNNLLEIAGGQKVYFDSNQNKWVPYSTTSTDSTIVSTDGTNQDAGPTDVDTDTDGTNQGTDPKKYEPLKFEKPQQKTRPLFDAHVPTLAKLWSDLSTLRKNKNLANSYNPKLKNAAHIDYSVRDGYHLENEYNKKANDLRARGTQNLTSNAEFNREQKLAYDLAATDIELQGVNKSAQIEAQERDKGVNVAAENKLRENKVAQENIDTLNALQAYRINNEKEYNTAKNAAVKGAIHSIATDFNKHRQTKALNKAYDKYYLDLKNANEYQQNLINSFNSKWGDYTTSQQYKDWVAWLDDPNNEGKFNPGTTPIADWAKDNWGSHAESKQFREAWQKAKDNDYNLLLQQLKLSGYVTEPQPQLITGEWQIPVSRAGQASPLYQKSGGKVDRLVEFAKLKSKEKQKALTLFQREQESVRRSANEYGKSNLRALEKQLDRLNQQQVMLLKQIFG